MAAEIKQNLRNAVWLAAEIEGSAQCNLLTLPVNRICMVSVANLPIEHDGYGFSVGFWSNLLVFCYLGTYPRHLFSLNIICDKQKYIIKSIYLVSILSVNTNMHTLFCRSIKQCVIVNINILFAIYIRWWRNCSRISSSLLSLLSIHIYTYLYLHNIYNLFTLLEKCI